MSLSERLPLSLWVAAFVWGLLFLFYVFSPGLNMTLNTILAGLVMAWSFTLLGWFATKTGLIPHRARIRKLATQHTTLAHVLYGALIFFIVSVLGRGWVFGIQFEAEGLLFILLATGVGGAFGFVVSLGMELDNGISDLSDMESGRWSFGFSFVLVFCVWIVIFAILASAGGWLFSATVFLTRIALSVLVYRYYPTLFNKDGWETLADHFLALSLMVIPPVAYLATL
ncbi:MAG: hypothetical protein OHK0046_44100 [Anaerolineae bacterium]